ncbi:MAG: PEP-CTERM sorting domain-containing protein [Phycisphaerales bacterium]|nr:PEP-CTERM sorting domain-containing protein [Phycisphaerales bacterium]
MTTEVQVDGQDDYDSTLTVVNPFVATHHAQLGLTEATTVFDLAWGPAGGRFDFLFDNVIDSTPDIAFSSNFGGVGFISDVDVWLDYEYIYAFDNLNGGIILTSINSIAHITDDGTHFLLRSVRRGGAGSLDPPSGIFTTTRHILLEAGEHYTVSYSIDIQDGFVGGVIGTGNGSLHFTLTPVPEPATAPLLAFAGVAAFRRHRTVVDTDALLQDAPRLFICQVNPNGADGFDAPDDGKTR